MCKNTKKTIFITGIAGFLGSHLADRMLESGHKVVGCDSLLGGSLDNVPDEAEFYQYDCNFYNSMVKIMKNADVVYHCAATAYEGLSVFSPYLVTKNIFQASMAVMTAAIANNVERFVFCSSMARYGAQNEMPFREDMVCKPQDPYGIAKWASELELANLAKVHGMDYVIAVPHNIIGPRQKYDDPYRNVVAIMINIMLQGKQPIIYGDGEQQRCFSFVGDDVDCMEKLAFQKNVSGEIINIGPDEETITINQLAVTIAEIIGFDLKPRYFPDRPQEVKVATCSADKARKLLGYQTKIALREGLGSMVEYVRMRGTKKFRYHLDIELPTEKCPLTWKNKLF